MVWSGPGSQKLVHFCAFLTVLLCLLTSVMVGAQVPAPIPFFGYITKVQGPESFEVDGKRVVTTPDTSYGLIGDKDESSDSTLWSHLQVGTYVVVTDDPEKSKKDLKTAVSVRIRDDWDRKLSGMGVIERVVSDGAQPVFEADGYDIRITPVTNATFAAGLKSLADAKAGVWLRYEGKRDKAGALMADKAEFIAAKLPKLKPLKHWEDSDYQFRPPGAGLKVPATPKGTPPPFVDFPPDDAVLTQDGGIRLGMMGHLHKMPADNALQTRIRRIGMRLVPAYQKELPADDPAKIPFHFYAVEIKNFRAEFIPFDGVILVSTEAADRLKSDDDLAAVLADGIACQLQLQQEKAMAANRALAGAYAVGTVASFFIPGAGLATLVGGGVAASKKNEEWAEQRARIALSLMADAGYDPRQAPEAWRLLEPKHLPKDVSELKYPDYSGYQLGILNLQYKSLENKRREATTQAEK